MKFAALLAVVGLFAIPFVSADPKAYELVKYKGTGEGVTVAYNFADGYPEASTVSVTSTASKKTTKFRYESEEDGKMRFVPEGKGKDEVKLKMGGYDPAPANLTGVYVSGGKEVAIKLKKN